MQSADQYFGRDLEVMTVARNYNDWILAEISPYLGNSVAEVGAGQGNFTEYLLSTGIRQLMAFEPSANMYELLHEKYADDARVSTINDFFEANTDRLVEQFDSIVYVNVLEHIEDDAEALTHAYQAIRPGGHLVIFVPALSFLYSEMDRMVGHYRRYSRKPLLSLVRAAGFEIERASYFDIAGIVPWYIAYVLLRQTTSKSHVSLYDRLVVPVMRRVEGWIMPPLGKNLLVIGKKASRSSCIRGF